MIAFWPEMDGDDVNANVKSFNRRSARVVSYSITGYIVTGFGFGWTSFRGKQSRVPNLSFFNLSFSAAHT